MQSHQPVKIKRKTPDTRPQDRHPGAIHVSLKKKRPTDMQPDGRKPNSVFIAGRRHTRRFRARPSAVLFFPNAARQTHNSLSASLISE